jgi:dTDP-4-dehydrorhamnose 3,5-epimerase
LKVIDTDLPGVKFIEPAVHGDDRGFLIETFHEQRYRSEAGITLPFVQDNHSRSGRGVLRGLHLQRRRPQGKLVRVVRGEVFDVVADVDPASATFGRWVGTTLSESNHRQIWIPPGYAHGFLVISDLADFAYKCTNYYDPQSEAGVVWNDPRLAIAWPLASPTLSERDKRWPTLAELEAAK